MRQVGALLIGFAVLSSRGHAQPSPDASALTWMSGCWELRSATRVTHESWMPPFGGTMLGMSRTVVGDVVREFEFLRVTRLADTLRYLAQPGGQSATSFTLAELTDSSVAFANAAHDFPQRIEYRRRGVDSLVARVSGSSPAGPRTVPFPMRRVRCHE
jgi:uncharacterized lipoprotein YddW (UPF0748 family)